MREMICIVCPRGCHLRVDENLKVEGNFCKRGTEYAINEITRPVRVLTSIVKIEGAVTACCPVKTTGGIPKDRIMDAVHLLDDVKLISPVKIGDVVVPDVLGTGVDWVVTRNL